MGIIKDLIQTIVVIVVLAVFIEMLLPQGEMRRYLKTIMGLLIILAILQAAATAVKSGFLQDVPSVMQSDQKSPSWEQIMATGQKLADIDKTTAAQKYQQGIAQQVLALAKLNQQITVLDVVVTTGGEMQEIKDIKIIFSAAPVSEEDKDGGATTDSLSEIKEVQIKVSSPQPSGVTGEVITPDPGQQQAAQSIAASVAQFYNLLPKQVQYEFRTEEKR